MDTLLNAIAELCLERGATAARIDRGTVLAKFGALGTVRITPERVS